MAARFAGFTRWRRRFVDLKPPKSVGARLVSPSRRQAKSVDTRATMPPPTQNTLRPAAIGSPPEGLCLRDPSLLGEGPGVGVRCSQRKQGRPTVSVDGQCIRDRRAVYTRPTGSVHATHAIISSPLARQSRLSSNNTRMCRQSDRLTQGSFMTQKNIPSIENQSHKSVSKRRNDGLLSESRRLLDKKYFPVQLDAVRQTTIPMPKPAQNTLRHSPVCHLPSCLTGARRKPIISAAFAPVATHLYAVLAKID